MEIILIFLIKLLLIHSFLNSFSIYNKSSVHYFKCINRIIILNTFTFNISNDKYLKNAMKGEK